MSGGIYAYVDRWANFGAPPAPSPVLAVAPPSVPPTLAAPWLGAATSLPAAQPMTLAAAARPPAPPVPPFDGASSATAQAAAAAGLTLAEWRASPRNRGARWESLREWFARVAPPRKPPTP